MKKYNKIACIALSLVSLCSVFFASCKKGGGNDDSGDGGQNYVTATPVTAENSQNHVYQVSESSDYLIQGGKSDYKIVISASATLLVQEAANEFFQFTDEASGVVLPIVTDTQAMAEGTEKFISIGVNALTDAAELSNTAGLGPDGYKIVTKEGNVYVIGRDYGSLNGVYGLLNLYFDYEFFYKDTYSLTKKTDVKFLNCNVKEIPDFTHRAGGYGTMWQDEETIRRYRMRIYSQQFIPVNGAIFHNAFHYLPYEDNKVTHAEWYNSSGDQICYTAHGDPVQYEAMVAETVVQLKKALSDTQYLDREMVTFSILDNNNSCSCDACNQIFLRYGAESAGIVLFLNDVNEQIRAWFADEGEEGGKAYARDLKLCFFAYNKYVKAPVTYDEAKGVYTANDIHCDDGVCALIAPLEADYTVDFDAKENEATKSVMLGWSVVSKDIATWYYDTLYVSVNNNFIFYNTFNGYQNRFKYAYNVGSIWMFNEGQDQIYGGQGAFNSLKMYISSRLAWNVNEDYQAMITRFFENFYGPAADGMYALFNEMKARAQYCKEFLGAGGDCYASWDKASFWPKETLIRWRGMLDQAIADLAPLKGTDAYDLYYAHIIYERVTLNYMLCTMYEGTLTETQFAQYRAEFIADAELSGNTRAQQVAQSWNS